MGTRILVKVTGDLVEEQKFYDWLKEIVIPTKDELYLILGAGSQTKALLEKTNIPYEFVGPKGFTRRKIESYEGRKMIYLLERKIKNTVRHKLTWEGITASIIDSNLEVDGEYLTQNGDLMAMGLCHNFDKTYVVTLPDREKPFLRVFGIEVVYL